MEYTITINLSHQAELRKHLYPGDDKEAVAFILCGYVQEEHKLRLLTHKVLPIAHDRCERDEQWVTWKTEDVKPILEEADAQDWYLLKVHSHPTGYAKFSETDDYSDKNFADFALSWQSNPNLFVSTVMLPDGSMFGRVVKHDLTFEPISSISAYGDFNSASTSGSVNLGLEDKRNAQAFGEKTVGILKNLSATVVGCSGTGSVVIEQLYRLGIGKLILIDPDSVEDINLNRIINSKRKHVNAKTKKVEAISNHIQETGLKTSVEVFDTNLCSDFSAQKALSRSDVIFGCVDSAEGRWQMNELSTSFLIPYFDVGVLLRAGDHGDIHEISGAIHYFTPGSSSVLSRGLITEEMLRAESTSRVAPEEYTKQKRFGYIRNIDVASPAVISVNMQAASLMVLEFLARVHPYRYSSNTGFARTMISISDWSIYSTSEDEFKPDMLLSKLVGIGDHYFSNSSNY